MWFFVVGGFVEYYYFVGEFVFVFLQFGFGDGVEVDDFGFYCVLCVWCLGQWDGYQ